MASTAGKPEYSRSSLPPESAKHPPETNTAEPVEELVVSATGLTGYWRLTASKDVDIDLGILSGITIRYGSEQRDRNICWVQEGEPETFTVTCAVSGSPPRVINGNLNGDNVTFGSWIGPATVAYSGRFTDNDHVVGGFSGGLLGVRITGNIPASLTRFVPSDTKELHSGALVRLAWEEVGSGHFTEANYEPAMLKRIGKSVPEGGGARLIQLTYLGQILAAWKDSEPTAVQDVYEIRTEVGRRVCRIGTGKTGRIAEFACVGLPS